MDYLDTNVTIPISQRLTPIVNTKFFLGGFNKESCIFKQCQDRAEATTLLTEYKSHPSVPHPILITPKNHPCFPKPYVCLDAPFQSIRNFFNLQKLAHSQNGNGVSFYRYNQQNFESVFFGSIRGMLDLMRRGFIVRNFTEASTVVFDRTDQSFKLYFLDVVKRGEDYYDLAVQLIKEVRNLIKEVVELSGVAYTDRERQLADGVPEAVLNFVKYVDDDYAEFMGRVDPEFVLFDPMIWTWVEKVIRSWNSFMFLEDNVHSFELQPYYEHFPNNWKQNIKRGSFFDLAITNQARKNKIEKAKVALASSVIAVVEKHKGQIDENYDYEEMMVDVAEIMLKYETDTKEAEKMRGLNIYENDSGVKSVGKIKRNGTNHHNQSAKELERDLKTLEEIVEFVEDEINFSCSRMFWHFIDVWLTGEIEMEQWIYHKEMLQGSKCWRDGIKKEKEDRERRRAEKKRKREEEVIIGQDVAHENEYPGEATAEDEYQDEADQNEEPDGADQNGKH